MKAPKTQILVQTFISMLILSNAKDDTPPRVAIIGAGVGGTSAAVFLRELFGDDVTIDIYEENKVGGRAAEIELNGYRHEAGGTIIHPRNQYMVNFTRLLGLEQQTAADEAISIYNGTDVIFSTSSSSIFSMAELFWRYGMDVYNIGNWVTELLKKFDRIYDHQKHGIAFTDVERLLSSMSPGFVEMSKHSFKDWMLKEGFHEQFIDELMHGGLECNYGQSTDIHAFVGGVSMAGVEPGLFSVKNGNKQIPELLLPKSKANLIKGLVIGIKMLEDKKYSLFYQRTKRGREETLKDTSVYDIVIIATPIHQHNNMEFYEFPEPVRVGCEFHRTVATFVQGKLNPVFAPVPNVFISETADNSFFNSINIHRPVNYSKSDPYYTDDIFRVFSKLPVSVDEIKSIFASHDKIAKADWLAYPAYKSEAKLASFLLHENMYYLNAIESAASAFEMSAIGAKNVALLAHNRWYGNDDYVDPILSETSKQNKNIEL